MKKLSGTRQLSQTLLGPHLNQAGKEGTDSTQWWLIFTESFALFLDLSLLFLIVCLCTYEHKYSEDQQHWVPLELESWADVNSPMLVMATEPGSSGRQYMQYLL